MKADTIAAVATAMSNSGIGIIRISGQEAVSVVDKIYVDKNGNKILNHVKSHTIHYGFIVDEAGKMIDEVMVSFMKGPKSFTAEDTVEINCHGGILVMNRILDLVIKNGARLAEPGEYTKRAFLNGRIDLSRAEAVMDVISSQNEMALKNSVRQMKGSLYNKMKELRKEIIYEIAFIESAIDDPEHISLEGYAEKLSKKIDEFISQTEKLLTTSDNGKMIQEGIHTVIVGKPNVGKSSLLNVLAGEERAIVTEIAGTTRDILEENIRLHNISLCVIDTAGIRTTEDIIEKIGVEKAKKYAAQADLIVYVVDSSLPMEDSDYEIIEMIRGKRCIVLLNKSDLESMISVEELQNKLGNDIVMIKTSTKENTGIEDFEKAIMDMFFKGDISLENEIMITNVRHKEALQNALLSFKEVRKSLEMDMPEDFYSIDLMNAYSSLGTIIGEEVGEDLINEIFSKFCMGK